MTEGQVRSSEGITQDPKDAMVVNSISQDDINKADETAQEEGSDTPDTDDTDEDVHPEYINLSATEREVFSQQQISAYEMRLKKFSYSDIRLKLGYGSDEAVGNSLYRMLCGDKSDAWTFGRPSLLSDVLREDILPLIDERSDALNCIEVSELMCVIEQKTAEHMHQAYARAIYLGLPTIAEKVRKRFDGIELSSSWLSCFLHRNGYKIKSAQRLDSLRRQYCHANVITTFFLMLRNTIHQCPRLLFNADETNVCLDGRNKVVAANNTYPVASPAKLTGHYTLMAAFNAAGDSVKPFIIIPNRLTFPMELANFINDACIASSTSGWMTTKLFTSWCLHFLRFLSTYRPTLPVSEQNLPCFLFLDGHKSRLNTTAIELLYAHNVRVIIFPAHSSHCTQPFDVGIASPFKRKLKSMHTTLNPNLIPPLDSAAAKERYVLFFAIIDAWKCSATKRNCASAFQATGIFPLNEQKVLERPDVRPTQPEDNLQQPPRGYNIGSKEITTDIERIGIAKYCLKMPTITSVDQIPKVSEDQCRRNAFDGPDLVLAYLPRINMTVQHGIVTAN